MVEGQHKATSSILLDNRRQLFIFVSAALGAAFHFSVAVGGAWAWGVSVACMINLTDTGPFLRPSDVSVADKLKTIKRFCIRFSAIAVVAKRRVNKTDEFSQDGSSSM